MAGYIVNQIVQKLRSEIEKHAGVLLFGARDELAYITDELAIMSAFLEEAEGVGDRAKVKREWVRQVSELAYDAEDCIEEFGRRLVQPTDQEIAGSLLRTSSRLLRAGADTRFLRICSRVLRASSGTASLFLRRARARVLGTWVPSTHFRRITAPLLRTGAGVRTLGRAGLEHGTLALRMGTRLIRTGNARYRFATEIKRIKAGVGDACKRAQQFGFISTPSNAAVDSAAARAGFLSQLPSRLNVFFVQDAELVGIEEHRDKLIDLLLDENKVRTSVISVVGCGGLGKTTLVRRVYENQRVMIDGGRLGHFDYRAWITVSASFELMGFLKKVFQELKLGDFNQELGPVQLIKQIRASLLDKRYVIILDDVWTVDAWKSIELVFSDRNMSGSRIVVTTRDENVADAACVRNHEHVIKLPGLSEEESMDLFCKIVFEGNTCPPDLKTPSKMILKKCWGVPLAIKAMGGVLARKPRTINVWNEMLYHLGSVLKNESELKEMTQIMTLSYEALPDYHLKRCFLYLSIFPEDYEINCKQLQALWIAEGMVEHDDHNMPPEKVAESYLKEFVCRNMIQASETSDRGRVKSCRVHDVMLEFIISKSTQLNLVTHGRKHAAASVRRLSLHQSTDEIFHFENSRSDHLRSLCKFGGEYDEPPPHPHGLVPVICRSKFLRVLELSYTRWLTSSHIHEIGKLYHLKYLGLQNTGVTRVPKSFGGLQNLETFYLSAGYPRAPPTIVPVEVFKLPKLRHLRIRRLIAPGGLGGSKTLQTLTCLYLEHGWEGEVQELRSLTQLRKLRLCGLRLEQGSDFCASISGMSSCLRSLNVGFDAGDAMGYLDSLASSPPKLLQTLRLDGYLGRLPGWINSNSLQAVSKIVLIESRLKFDAIQTLQKLPNLVELRLSYQSYLEKELHFDGEGFGRLKTLQLSLIDSLESLAFSVGSMPSLHVLQFNYCGSLDKVGKFDHENLPCLSRVVFQGRHQVLYEIAKAHPNNPICILCD